MSQVGSERWIKIGSLGEGDGAEVERSVGVWSEGMDGSMPERSFGSSLPKGQEEVVGSEALCLVVGREGKRVDDLYEDGRARLCANLFSGK
jgi:hypothetical protein